MSGWDLEAERLADHAEALLLDAQHEVLTLIEADEVELSRLQARMTRHRAELARIGSELAESDRDSFGVIELAGTARIGQRKAATQLADADRLVRLFPQALPLLESGALRVGTMAILLQLTRNAREDVQAVLGERLLERLAPLDAQDARRLVATTLPEVEAELDPQAQEDRYDDAHDRRGVSVQPIGDGMAGLSAAFDEVAAHRFVLDLDELVRQQKLADERHGVVRSPDQRRADVLAELPSRHLALLQAVQAGEADALLAQARGEVSSEVSGEVSSEVAEFALWWLAQPVRNPVTMYVHVPVTTVLDLDHRSGWVEGLGAVRAHQARLLRPVATLRRVLADAETGVPLAVDPPGRAPDPVVRGAVPDPERVRRRLDAFLHDAFLHAALRPTAIDDTSVARHDPTPAQRRLLAVRDQGCTGIGCATSARGSEADHELAWTVGGQTAVWNLALKSPRCHHAKHGGWSVRRDERTGAVTWVGPTGRRYERLSPWALAHEDLSHPATPPG